MRVTIVSRIYRPEPAAASYFLGAVADALVDSGHDVDVITVRPPKGLAVESRGEHVRVWPVLRDRTGYVRGYLSYMSFDIPMAFRLLFARRPDVVFVEPPPTTGAVVRVVCAMRRIPYVYDAADIWSDAAEMATTSSTVIRVLRWIERFAWRGAAHLVTVSTGVSDRIQALRISQPMTVTGFGADTSAFESVDVEPQPLFVYAGTYSVWHGAAVLVDAFADFSATHPGYILRFIGNGSEREVLERRAVECGVADAVEFLDPISGRELSAHLGAAVASLATQQPSMGYDYAFASKAYSSMAAGCPVIFAGPGPTGAFIASANEHVQAGIPVAHDASATAAAMRTLADSRVTKDERRALAAWTAAEHSLNAVARRVVGVIDGVAAARGSRT